MVRFGYFYHLNPSRSMQPIHKASRIPTLQGHMVTMPWDEWISVNRNQVEWYHGIGFPVSFYEAGILFFYKPLCKRSKRGVRNMRFSQLLVPTMRENPAEAEIVSHQLMLRAGLMRKLASGP